MQAQEVGQDGGETGCHRYEQPIRFAVAEIRKSQAQGPARNVDVQQKPRVVRAFSIAMFVAVSSGRQPNAYPRGARSDHDQLCSKCSSIAI
jgi:hypothetical protein